jgi:nucleoid DNA-binding protein
MQELIDQLKDKAGITDEQAVKAIEAIKEFVKDKFPMMAGAVDKLFEGK